MYNLRTKVIDASNSWEPRFEGVFYLHNCVPAFLFLGRQSLCRLDWGKDQPQILYTSKDMRLPCPPRNWKLVENAHSSYLVFEENNTFNLANENLMTNPPSEVLSIAKSMSVREKHFEDDSFCFDGYRIEHKGAWGYECYFSGKKIWEFQGKGYLYTEIVRWKDHIYFGTAGCGGYFYCLDLKNGIPLTQIKTGGTKYIVQRDDCCYLLSNHGQQSQLLCVDIISGKIVSCIDVPGKTTSHSVVQIIDSELYSITFAYKKGQLMQVYWNRCCL